MWFDYFHLIDSLSIYLPFLFQKLIKIIPFTDVVFRIIHP